VKSEIWNQEIWDLEIGRFRHFRAEITKLKLDEPREFNGSGIGPVPSNLAAPSMVRVMSELFVGAVEHTAVRRSGNREIGNLESGNLGSRNRTIPASQSRNHKA